MRLELTHEGLLVNLANHYTTRGTLDIYEVSCWFLLSKIHLILNSRIFSQTFSPDLGKFFFHSDHFLENEKDGNHSVQGMINMLDGVEQTRLYPIFFPAWFLPNVPLHYHWEEQRFRYWQVQCFFRFSLSLCSCWGYKSAIERLTGGLKTQNE